MTKKNPILALITFNFVWKSAESITALKKAFGYCTAQPDAGRGSWHNKNSKAPGNLVKNVRFFTSHRGTRDLLWKACKGAGHIREQVNPRALFCPDMRSWVPTSNWDESSTTTRLSFPLGFSSADEAASGTRSAARARPCGLRRSRLQDCSVISVPPAELSVCLKVPFSRLLLWSLRYICWALTSRKRLETMLFIISRR